MLKRPRKLVSAKQKMWKILNTSMSRRKVFIISTPSMTYSMSFQSLMSELENYERN